MRSILILLVLLISASIAESATTWDKDIYWWPSASQSRINFAQDLDNNEYINMTNLTLQIKSWSNETVLNFTIHNNANATLETWNITYINISLTQGANISIGGLDESRYYFVVRDGVNIWSDLNASADNGIITFNISESGYYQIQWPGAKISVPYSMFNGTYNYAENQSIWFWCFPLHPGCVPTYQNTTQWLFNYTNTNPTSRALYLRLNDTQQGYTIRASNANDNESTVTIGMNSTLVNATVQPGEMVKFWMWIDTLYPFKQWYNLFTMEEA